MKSYLFSLCANFLNWTNNIAKIVTVLVLLLSSSFLIVLLMVSNVFAKFTMLLWHLYDWLIQGILWCIERFSAGVDWLGSCLFGCIDDIYNSLDR